MSIQSPLDMMMTATVCIFSPDMKEIIVKIHTKLNRIMPPWGKFDSHKDMTLLDTALRETREELWLALFPWTGVFLDVDGNPIIDAEPVQRDDFVMLGDSSIQGTDHLFFFRLHDPIQFDIWGEGSRGYFFTKGQIERERWELEGNMYQLFFRSIRDAVLRVMQ